MPDSSQFIKLKEIKLTQIVKKQERATERAAEKDAKEAEKNSKQTELEDIKQTVLKVATMAEYKAWLEVWLAQGGRSPAVEGEDMVFADGGIWRLPGNKSFDMSLLAWSQRPMRIIVEEGAVLTGAIGSAQSTLYMMEDGTVKGEQYIPFFSDLE